VKKSGKIAAPLMPLLKKNTFVWSEVTSQAFNALKDAMCTTLVLAIPNFNNIFVMECDASGRGLR
jgi:hypothetical protein